MINFRYHVVSLIAVFLALGMGVLVGSSFISEGTVDVLRRNLRALEKANQDLTEDVQSLETSESSLEKFAAQTKSRIVRGQLTNKPMVIVSFENTPEELADSIAQTLTESGALVEGSIRLSDKLDIATQPRREQLALALQSQETDQTKLRQMLIERLVQSLTGAGGGTIARLVDAELATLREVGGGASKPAQDLVTAGRGIVLIGTPDETSKEIELGLMVPLTQALSTRTMTAVCDSREDARLLEPLRSDSAIKIVTIDGIEGPVGQAALVLGLAAAYEGRFGHYGSSKGATSVIPEPVSNGR